MSTNRSNNIIEQPWYSSQRHIATLLILAMVVPNMLLITSQGGLPLSVAYNLLLPLAAYVLLFSFFKKPGTIILWGIPIVVVHAYEVVFHYLFYGGVITSDMFLNTVTTDVGESTDVLSNIYPSLIAVAVIYVPALILAVRSVRMQETLDINLRKKARRWSAYAVGTLAALTALFSLWGKVDIVQDCYPINVLYNLSYSVHKWNKIETYPDQSKSFRFAAKKTQQAAEREVFVLVIGESSRAFSWSLSGYERNTNPRLAKLKGLAYFTDAIAEANATQKSVPLILSSVSAERYQDIYKQKGTITAFKEAGFKTFFVMNQVPNFSLTGYLASEADSVIDMNKGSILSAQSLKRDEEIIPVLERIIDSTPGNIFVVLHTYGSHFQYRTRYTQAERLFTPDVQMAIREKNKTDLINAYDNSIVYTDKVLSQLANMLNSKGLYSSMLFTSDHGENLYDDSRMLFLHSTPYPTVYELRIPFFAWFSDSYVAANPKALSAAVANRHKAIDTKSVFHSLLDMAHISSPYLDVQSSIINPKLRNDSNRMIVGDHDNGISYTYFFKPSDYEADRTYLQKVAKTKR